MDYAFAFIAGAAAAVIALTFINIVLDRREGRKD